MPGRVPSGSFLLAVPQLQDPNFMHTLVLLVDHGARGAFGLVCNRSLEVTIGELLADRKALRDCEFPVYCGGPVATDSLQFLHRIPAAIPGGLEVVPGLFLGGEPDALEGALVGGEATPENLRLFVGYSGWGEGQLDGELAIGSWVVAPPDPLLVFDERRSDALWRRVLRGLGSDGEGLSHIPPDVSWN